jgi:hypothetical protein
MIILILGHSHGHSHRVVVLQLAPECRDRQIDVPRYVRWFILPPVLYKKCGPMVKMGHVRSGPVVILDVTQE